MVRAAQFHLADLFEIAARAAPDRLAVKADARELTYAAMNERADLLASGLHARGLRRGDKVGLYMMNAPEYLEAFIGASKLGAVPYNVNYRYRADELRYLFANADSAAIIHGAEFGDIVDAVRSDVPTLKLSVAVGEGATGGNSIPYEELLETGPSLFERSEDDILIQYTGGTTGLPKGVMWPHKAFIFACAGGGGYFHAGGPIKAPQDIASRVAEGPPLRMFTVAPLMHGAAIWAAWSALLGGLTIILDPMRRFDPEKIWDRAERDRANLVQVVGDAMAIPLRDALRANPGRWNLGHVVNFGSGGAVFSKHVKDDIRALLPTAMITDGMGTSETGIAGLAEPSAEGVMRLPATETQTVVIGDRKAAVGETGYIARTGMTPVGYYNDPQKTAETFRTIDGRLWAIAGDAGRLDADGKITMFGRGSTCINTGGEKVYPEEVEEALRRHPAIFDAVVAGQKDERWGERVVAIVSLRPEADSLRIEDVKNHLSTLMAGYKIPKALVIVDEIRRSPAGKQDYRWAKELAAAAA